MVRLRMLVIGTGSGRASWHITRVRRSRLHNSTAMDMAPGQAMVVATSLLLPRNSGLSEEMDATWHITNGIPGVYDKVELILQNTIGIRVKGYFGTVAGVEDGLHCTRVGRMGVCYYIFHCSLARILPRKYSAFLVNVSESFIHPCRLKSSSPCYILAVPSERNTIVTFELPQCAQPTPCPNT
jgi:hypothetical protein